MPEGREQIPAPTKRAVLVEAGHRCAIPTCRQVPVEIAHITPYARTKDNRFENLIALCPTCHTRFDTGQIDRPSMRQYKANLSVISSRYSDLERRVIEHFVNNPQQDTILLPGGLQLLLGYLIKDGLLEMIFKLVPSIGGSIFTNDEYQLTGAGREFVGHLRGNEPLADVIAWAEDYWPNGRHIYYEGNEPAVFAATVKAEFGLDVTSDNEWAQIIDDGDGSSFTSYGFDCPSELLGQIYYSNRWPIGS
jgi:HNH endonuclease